MLGVGSFPVLPSSVCFPILFKASARVPHSRWAAGRKWEWQLGGSLENNSATQSSAFSQRENFPPPALARTEPKEQQDLEKRSECVPAAPRPKTVPGGPSHLADLQLESGALPPLFVSSHARLALGRGIGQGHEGLCPLARPAKAGRHRWSQLETHPRRFLD